MLLHSSTDSGLVGAAVTTSAQLNPCVALTGRPGQSRDVGGRLGLVLGITAKLTLRNLRYNLMRFLAIEVRIKKRI